MDTNSIESLDNIRPEENQIISQDITPIEVIGKNYYLVSSPIDQIGVYEVRGKTNFEISHCFFWINKIINEERLTNKGIINLTFIELSLLARGKGYSISKKIDLDLFSSEKWLFLKLQTLLPNIFLPKEKMKALYLISSKLSLKAKTEKIKTDFTTPDKDFPKPDGLEVSPFNHFSFINRTIGKNLGYYSFIGQLGIGYVRLTDFIININQEIEIENDGKKMVFFKGELIHESGKIYQFENLSLKILSNKRYMHAFIAQYLTTGFLYKFDSKVEYSIIRIILEFNDIVINDKIEAVHFGYNLKLNAFHNSNMEITANEIKSTNYSIINKEFWKPNLPYFIEPTEDKTQLIKNDIIDLLIESWKPKNIILPILAFSLLPLVFPFLERLKLANRKPFMLLKGMSGSGKTETAKLMMRFYSNYEQVIPVNSTEASIEKGYSMLKDTLFLIDDVKERNFANKSELNKFIFLLQNYSDRSIRNKLNGSKILTAPEYISSFLLMTGEELVINSPSTIARGIILNMVESDYNFELTSKLNALSKKFLALTPLYIQFLLKEFQDQLNSQTIGHSFESIDTSKYCGSNDSILGFTRGTELLTKTSLMNRDLLENAPRIIDSFRLLFSSWYSFSKFLFDIKGREELISIRNQFDIAMQELFIENLRRANVKTAYKKFTEALNELLEDKKYKLIPYELANVLGEAESTLGFYSKVDDQVKICIKLKKAYKIINRHLQLEGGIGISYESLLDQLALSEFIKVNSSGLVSFPNQYKARGVEWISKLNFNFPDDNGKTSETSVTFVTTEEDELNSEVQTEVQLK